MLGRLPTRAGPDVRTEGRSYQDRNYQPSSRHYWLPCHSESDLAGPSCVRLRLAGLSEADWGLHELSWKREWVRPQSLKPNQSPEYKVKKCEFPNLTMAA